MTATGKQPLAKQVIYVDVDDEITTVIDKVNATEAKVVALVLPKRAAVFQSVVNMKLLKRRADSAKKHLVLITSEAGLMPLAGMAGVHVAPTLQSKPEIPSAGNSQDADDDEEEASLDNDDFDPTQNSATPVGALAGGATGAAAARGSADDEVIELDNTDNGKKMAAASSKPTASPKKAPKDKKLKIPNFFSFRKRLILAALALVLLIVGWYFAYFVMPKATVTIRTNSSDVDASLALTLDTAASAVDEKKLVLPAQSKQEQKANTGQTPATGQENKGEKATGPVTLSIACNKVSGSPPQVPAGTGISDNGLTFITQKTVELNKPSFSGGCRFTGDTTVIAQKPGSNYNVKLSKFKVAGFDDIEAESSAAMTGGTDNNVKVVQQSDIDGARQKLASSQDQTAIKRQLQERLEEDGLYALTSTFAAGTPNVTTSSNVGEEAETVTVTESTTYTMFGVKKDDLEKVVETELRKKINTAEQDVLDNGLSAAKVSVETPGAGPQLKVDVAVTAVVGPKIDTDQLKQDIKGQKDGIVKDRIKQIDGVEDVEVKYSPFWVTKAPKAEKITIQFEKSSTKGSADGN